MTRIVWGVGVACVCLGACGSDDGGSGGTGGGASGSGGASSGGASGGGGSGGATAGSGGGAATGGGGGVLNSQTACLPSGACTDDAAYPYKYACNAIQSIQPEVDCIKPTSGPYPETMWCCKNKQCVRQQGTEYLCTDAAKPNSYLCHEGMTLPDGCAESMQKNGVQICCP